jgi:GR25 family glycosyltransferase involved in LPS biosynthesis
LKSFVITLYGHPYSEAVSERCAISAREIGKIQVQRFDAITKEHALDLMSSLGLRWTWAGKPYPGPLAPRVGCAMSHFLLWRQCVQEDQPILILEHDAVFIRERPEIEFDGICQINDPRGCTPKGAWWSDYMATRGPGVFPKTKIFHDDRPDGLAGNSAYVIKPWAAQQLIYKAREVGLWPNDALMCSQFFPFLQ